jgi:hypothetical protein
MTAFLPPSVLDPNVDGVLVETADWISAMCTYIQQAAGFPVAGAQGFGNGIPQSSAPVPPLVCVPGSALHVVIGSGASSTAPQWALIAGVFSACEAPQTFAVPPNSSGSTRQDIVCVQQVMVQGSTVSRPVEGGGSQNIPYDYSGMQFQYVEGRLTPPTGYQVFAIISVPNGASSITTGDIAVQFTTMNPTGATGPAGPGTTTLTSNITIPAIGGTVSMPVAAAAAYPNGAQGLAIDNASSTAMYFVVVGGTGDTLLVMNVGAFGLSALGYSNSGTLHQPGWVIFGSAAPNTFTTASLNLPAFGANLNIDVNALDQFPDGSWGLCFNATKAFIFQTQSSSPGTLAVTCALLVQGTSGASMGSGAYVVPIAPPAIFYKNGSPVVAGVVEHQGAATVSGPGVFTVAVGFAVPFADTTYAITIGANGNFNAWWTNKTVSGFTMNFSEINSEADWSAKGALAL